MEQSNTYGYLREIREKDHLSYLINSKYVNVLGKFIKTMYPNLKFKIFVRDRNKKHQKSDWYGMTYMNLVIYNVISSAEYNPLTYNAYYRVYDYKELISFENFYDTIDSYMPEMNKHLLISFEPPRNENIPIDIMIANIVQIPDYECWVQYYKRSIIKRYHKSILTY